MLIDTKFDVGDTCYIVEGMGILKGIIKGIQITKLTFGNFKFDKQLFSSDKLEAELDIKFEIASYDSKYSSDPRYYRGPVHCYKTEEELFQGIRVKPKEELLKQFKDAIK